jgi:hypothetical protein
MASWFSPATAALFVGGVSAFAFAVDSGDYCCPTPDQPQELIVLEANEGHPQFNWLPPMGGADEFYLELLRNGKSCLKKWVDAWGVDVTVRDIEFTPAVYHVRVSAGNPCGKGPATRWIRFEIPACVTETPEALEPTEKSSLLGYPEAFAWSEVTDATWYKLIVKKGTKTYLSQTIGYGYGYGAPTSYEPSIATREKDLPKGI